MFAYLKHVPKTRVYKMLRKGEVRVNKGRVKQSARINTGDVIRIPPVHQADAATIPPSRSLVDLVENSILTENPRFIVLNKPSGISVHSGSRDQNGVIEALRATGDNRGSYQLVHRLDRMTSGCLLIAKDSQALRVANEALRQQRFKKNYLTLMQGQPGDDVFDVDVSMSRGHSRSGERMSEIDADGKRAKSRFSIQQRFKQAALADVWLQTGRTHQIRVHASHLGHPLALDNKYGDPLFNKEMKQLGLKRLFLHASRLECDLDELGIRLNIHAPLPEDLQFILQNPEL